MCCPWMAQDILMWAVSSRPQGRLLIGSQGRAERRGERKHFSLNVIYEIIFKNKNKEIFLRNSIMHFPHVQSTFFNSVIIRRTHISLFLIYINSLDFYHSFNNYVSYLTSAIFLLHVHLHHVALWTAPASFYVFGIGSPYISLTPGSRNLSN